MRADQREFRLGVVKTADVNPRARAVASLAAKRRAVGALLCHAVVEFSLMRVHVAGRAGAVREVERQNLVGAPPKTGFVAVGASYGDMRARQHEAGVLVLGDGECRAVKILYRV